MDDTLRLDAHAVTVLAHPLRTRLLTALRLDGPATATALAGRLGTNTGATSYHLRRLAEVGLVVAAADHAGRGRERWWQAATRAHSFYPSDVEDSPDARAALTWLQQSYQHDVECRAAAWYAHSLDEPIEWQDAAGSSDEVLTLDAATTTALMADLSAVVARYREAEPSTGAEARRVFVVLNAFPEVADELDRTGGLPEPS
ncbi:helix-turn-helix domain-containing protein [Cellulomonas sp. JH27-2]|uniref:winged helix-turn-helix domain-containing protein n=1 Tax=Cellulomonas sp. JH27-2 TaxID=2774139 RepID=UPI00177E4749|nr:winged helix-turn-helix domain-containing protein [Cellulomonas sp. JH27-2]MBD8058898.1 helix-turn-helix domain-containing protein [Cellulomonas sp. JH27-2]